MDHGDDVENVEENPPDMYAQFEPFDAFLDMTDFSTLIPQDFATDHLVREHAIQDLVVSQQGHKVANTRRRQSQAVAPGGGEQYSPLSRFGSPLPDLPYESRDSIFRHPPQVSHPHIRPCWKVSEPEYREILTNLEDFSDVLPRDFRIPSRHTMSRYVEGCIKGLYNHLPCLHIPTFAAAKATPALLLSMMAIGSQFRFEGHRSLALFNTSKVVLTEQIRRCHLEDERLSVAYSTSRVGTKRTTPSGSSGSTDRVLLESIGDQGRISQGYDFILQDQLMQAGQAIIGLLVMGAWGTQQLVREAMNLQSLAATIARDNGLSGPTFTEPSEGRDLDWHSWIRKESIKRTNLMIFCILQLISTAYHVPPSILTSEINCCLPASADEWNAKTSMEWKAIRSSSGAPERPFQECFGLLFLASQKSPPYPSFSSLDNYVLILTLLQHIFLLQQTFCSSRTKSLGSADMAEISRALACWQTLWERSPDSTIDPASAYGPVAFNSTALLRLAWIRLYAGDGPWRYLGSRDVMHIAYAFNGGTKLKRSPGLIGPALQAAHALSIPVRMGTNFVARAQLLSWSVQHALSNLECAIFLSKWLEELAVTSVADPLDHEELRIVQMIQSLLHETGRFEDDEAVRIRRDDVRGLKQQIRWLATGVARLWADIFNGTHFFEVVNVIGLSLGVYADAMAAAHTPPTGP